MPYYPSEMLPYVCNKDYNIALLGRVIGVIKMIPASTPNSSEAKYDRIRSDRIGSLVLRLFVFFVVAVFVAFGCVFALIL